MGIPKSPRAEDEILPWYEEPARRNTRRALFVRRFSVEERRRRPRRWISFPEIIAYCSNTKTTTESDMPVWNAEIRKDLTIALIEGLFYERGRSMVLYLAPNDPVLGARKSIRLTAELARELRNRRSDTTFREFLIDHCWLHRRVCLTGFGGWLFWKGFVPNPDWFIRSDSGEPKQPQPPVAPLSPALLPRLEADPMFWQHDFRAGQTGNEWIGQPFPTETQAAKPGSLFPVPGPGSQRHDPVFPDLFRNRDKKQPGPRSDMFSNERPTVAVAELEPATTVALNVNPDPPSVVSPHGRIKLAIRNKPGGGGIKKAGAVDAMLYAVRNGNATFHGLRTMKEKQLTVFFQAGRTCLREAREVALAQLANEGYTDKSAT